MDRLSLGDVAVVRGPAPYTVADEPDRPPQAIILPTQECVPAPGLDASPMSMHGVRTWGNDPAGGTEMLTGTYQVSREVSQRLLRALPPWSCSARTSGAAR